MKDVFNYELLAHHLLFSNEKLDDLNHKILGIDIDQKLIQKKDQLTFQFEILANDGSSGNFATVSGLTSIKNSTTQNCTITAVNALGVGSIKCVILNAPSQVNGKYVQWNRDTSGEWSCTSDAGAGYMPKACKAPST